MHQRSDGHVLDLARGRPALVALGLGLVYAVLAQTISWASTFSAAGTSAASFWPAAGVSVVALLLLPRRRWGWALGGVLVAEVALDLHNGVPLGASLGWGAANVLEPLCSALLLRRVGRRLPDLARREDLLPFVGCAVVAGPLVGGAVAALSGALTASSLAGLALTWVRWSVGDAVGVLAVAPALLALGPSARTRTAFPAGPVALVGLLAAVSFAVTELLGRLQLPVDSLICLLVPALAWLALRGGQRASATGVLLVALVVETATAAGQGPFAGDAGLAGLVDAQLFLAACALTASLVSVATHDLVRHDELATRLRAQAGTDALTGLANRRRVFEQAADLTGRGSGFTACLVVDLDGFKQVNDTHGHAGGDAVLVEVARRLAEATREGDLVARTGGDEFLVCLSRPCTDEDLAHLAGRVAELVQRPVHLADGVATVGASVGVALASGHAAVDELVRRADQDMYEAKQHRPRVRPALAAEASPAEGQASPA